MGHEFREIFLVQSSKKKGKRRSYESDSPSETSVSPLPPKTHSVPMTSVGTSSIKLPSSIPLPPSSFHTCPHTTRLQPQTTGFLSNTGNYARVENRLFYFLEREAYADPNHQRRRRLPRLISAHSTREDAEWHMREHLNSLEGRSCEKWWLQEHRKESAWCVRWETQQASHQGETKEASSNIEIEGFDIRLTNAAGTCEEEAWAVRTRRWRRYNRYEPMASIDEYTSQEAESEFSMSFSSSSEEDVRKKSVCEQHKNQNVIYRLFPTVQNRNKTSNSSSLSLRPNIASSKAEKPNRKRRSLRQVAAEHWRSVMQAQ